MKLSRLLLVILICCVTVSWFPKAAFWKKKIVHTEAAKPRKETPATLEKAHQKALAARSYAKHKGFSTTTCFLVEMGLPSGSNRFFIYDLVKDSITGRGLVTHGNCFQSWLDGRKYSNTVGSGCTSLGRYKVGGHYVGKWGYSYKLFGLDSTNSNAIERTVVLHSHSCVPEQETTDEICQSNGCTTVSPGFLEKLKDIINNSGKPILLWVYE